MMLHRHSCPKLGSFFILFIIMFSPSSLRPNSHSEFRLPPHLVSSVALSALCDMLN